MDLTARTVDALDWAFVLEALAAEARTGAGARAALALNALESKAAIEGAFDAIEEVELLEEEWPLPIGGVSDIAKLVRRCKRGGIAHDLDLRGELSRAFDLRGQLSGETYPELAELRATIHELHLSVRRTLDELRKGDELSDILQDDFVAMRGDRYVLRTTR